MTKFGDAFKAARKAGKKSFTFNGKSYHTRTKEEDGPKSPKVPARRPDSKKAPKGLVQLRPGKAPEKKEAPAKKGSTQAKGRPKGFTTKRYKGPGK